MNFIGIRELLHTTESELLTKARSIELIPDPKVLDEPVAKYVKLSGLYTYIPTETHTEKLEPNSKYEIDGDICETDDTGDIYKINGELLPNKTFEQNGISYTTDDSGTICKVNGEINPNSEYSIDEKTYKLEQATIDVRINQTIELTITKIAHCPIEGHNGSWESERGESKWVPDREAKPKLYNPNGLTWGEILDKYGIDGIEYKDGEPDFSPVSKGDVQIDDFTDDRQSNFAQADEKLAEQRGCSPEDVKKWREENGYTWHECGDCKTMQKVPREIHNNMPHSGGVSEYKQQQSGNGGNS